MQTTPSPLFVAAHGTRLRLSNGQIVVERTDGIRTQLPIEQVGGIVAIGRGVDCSSALLLALAERGRATVFIGAGGETTGVFMHPGVVRGRALEARAAQHAIERQRGVLGASAPGAVRLARRLVDEKLLAIDAVLAQHDRSHADVDLAEPRRSIADLRGRLAHADSVDAVRGLEGSASATYWQAIPALFRSELTTTRRTRRPPRDECNAALSFGYALLLGEVCAAVALEGLEPALGVLHSPAEADARPALALDLMEPWRHAVIDRLVIRAANRRELRPTHFERLNDGTGESVYSLNEDGRREFLAIYSRAMQSASGEAGTVRDALVRSVRAYADRVVFQASVPECVSHAAADARL